MADIPRYLVDGLLSVATHNGVHRFKFYALVGSESPQAQPNVEIAISETSIGPIMQTMTRMLGVRTSEGKKHPASAGARLPSGPGRLSPASPLRE